MPDISNAVSQPLTSVDLPVSKTGKGSAAQGPVQGLVLEMPGAPTQRQVGQRDESTPAGQLAGPFPALHASAPLSEGVAPFTPKGQSAPSVEYVPFTQPLPLELQPNEYGNVRNVGDGDTVESASFHSPDPSVVESVQSEADFLAPAAAQSIEQPNMPPEEVPSGAVQPVAQTAQQLMKTVRIPQAGMLASRPVEYTPRAAPTTVNPSITPQISPSLPQQQPLPNALPTSPSPAPSAARNYIAAATPPAVHSVEPSAPKPVQQTVSGRLQIAPAAPSAPIALPVAPVQPNVPIVSQPVVDPVSQPARQPSVSSIRSGKALILFSANTRAIWQMRRMQKVLTSLILIGLCIAVVGLIGYWLSIGAPTTLHDIPFLKAT